MSIFSDFVFTDSESDSSDTGNVYVPDSTSDDNHNDVQVSTCTSTISTGRYVYGPLSRGELRKQKHCCLFCERVVYHVERHLSTAHKGEKDVEQLLAKPKTAQSKGFSWLRLRGDFFHNRQVLDGKKEGELIVVKRPDAGVQVLYANYLPCTMCYGFFQKDRLWKHAKTCAFRPENDKPFQKHQRNSRMLLTNETSSVYVNYRKDILNTVNRDTVGVAASQAHR